MSVHVAPSVVSFAEYQAIHQEQQRLRYPNQKAPGLVTSDSWKAKVRHWAALAIVGVTFGYWIRPGAGLTWIVMGTTFLVARLLYQWWEYRQAYQLRPHKQQAVSFVVEAREVRCTREGRTHCYRWADFYRIQRVRNWLLLYTCVEHCYYLNLDRIQPPATVADVERLLAEQPRLRPAARDEQPG